MLFNQALGEFIRISQAILQSRGSCALQGVDGTVAIDRSLDFPHGVAAETQVTNKHTLCNSIAEPGDIYI